MLKTIEILKFERQTTGTPGINPQIPILYDEDGGFYRISIFGSGVSSTGSTNGNITIYFTGPEGESSYFFLSHTVVSGTNSIQASSLSQFFKANKGSTISYQISMMASVPANSWLDFYVMIEKFHQELN